MQSFPIILAKFMLFPKTEFHNIRRQCINMFCSLSNSNYKRSKVLTWKQWQMGSHWWLPWRTVQQLQKGTDINAGQGLQELQACLVSPSSSRLVHWRLPQSEDLLQGEQMHDSHPSLHLWSELRAIRSQEFCSSVTPWKNNSSYNSVKEMPISV